MFAQQRWAIGAAIALAVSITAGPVLAQGAATRPEMNKRITLELKDAKLRFALEMLFKAAEVKNYTLDPSIQEAPVTVTLTDVRFPTALESILRSVSSIQPLTYDVVDGIYNVKPKVDLVQDTTAAPEEPKDTTPKARIQRISGLSNHIDVATLAEIMNSSGMSGGLFATISAIPLDSLLNPLSGGFGGGFGGGGQGGGGFGGGGLGQGGGLGGGGGGLGGGFGGGGGGGFGGGGFGGGGGGGRGGGRGF